MDLWDYKIFQCLYNQCLGRIGDKEAKRAFQETMAVKFQFGKRHRATDPRS